ncbi:MAG: DUF3352 domain-containing protein [Bacteroidales bacterium]|nr:DUF3352 domain-containing protein [Bacteroidales bacterium]MCF8456335.1 DUF3352 domain-containing protein [Bacteroidales bacterium]
MKRIIQWIVFVLILVGLSWVSYRYFLSQRSFEPDAAYSAVPVNSPFILEINNLNDLVGAIRQKNQMHEALKAIPQYNKLSRQLILFDSSLKVNPGLKNYFNDHALLLTAGITGKGKFDFLFIVGFPNSSIKEAGESFVRNRFGSKDSWQERDYDKYSIYTSTKGGSSISYSIANGVLIISPNGVLVESALQQCSSDSNIAGQLGFSQIKLTAGKNSTANLFVNHKALPTFLALSIEKGYAEAFRKLESYSSWSEFDVTIKDSELYLNGFSMSTDNQSFMHIFSDQAPVNIAIESVLPANTSTFFAFGIDDVDAFRTSFRQYQGYNSLSNEYLDELTTIKQKYKVDLEDILYNQIDHEIALAFTEIRSKDIFANSFLIIKTLSPSRALEDLTGIIEAYAGVNDMTLADFRSDFCFDEVLSRTIYEMPFHNIGSLLFGSLFGNTSTKYFTFIENYLVFGPSRAAIGNFIHENLLHKNLANDFNYLEFSSQTADKSNFYFYSNIASSLALFSPLLNAPLKTMFEENTSVFQEFHAMSFQFAPHGNNNMVYNDLYLKYEPVYTDKPHTAWELRLDAPFSSKPKFLLNHSNGNQEIFIQDDKHKIYLINYAGRILWEKQLDQAILGEVNQIDFYKNGKLQMLFNTKDKIHLIDRLGNYVERYPVNLNSPATNGLGLVDYDNNKEYRIFIACEDKRVYLYTKEGNIVDGWKFRKSEHPVNGEIQHFRDNSKDYLVFNDENKSYFLDRKGRERVDPDTQFPISKHGKYIFEERSTANKARMIVTGPDGTVYMVYFDGKVETHKFREFSNEHWFDYFDMDGDGVMDFVFVDGKKLEVYNLIKTKIIDLEFEQEISLPAIPFMFPGGKQKLGIVADKRNEIYLINSDGSMYDGFPLTGRTLFSIGSINKNQKFNLFVGTNNNFLYNYEVK